MMHIRTAILLIGFINCIQSVNGQCTTPINTFPYNEGFETSGGGWFAGGTGSDWTWGTPSKPVITAAGGGTRCWIIGGLTASSYTNAEASWLQSPCFDLTSLQYPYITFKVFWEMEQRFDGASLQYSTDNGTSWSDLGSFNETASCLNAHWYNYVPITYLAPLSTARNGWSGNIQSSSGSCQGGNGSNGWVTAKHIMPALAGQAAVIFRFTFGAGTICNNYDGFAIDDITIGEAPPNSAGFTYTCKSNSVVDFADASALCPTTFSWDFGDPASGTNNVSSLKNPSHTFSAPGPYTVSLTVSSPGNAPSTIMKPITVLGLTASVITPADCINNDGGSAMVNVTGGSGSYSYSWSTTPIQTNATVIDLSEGTYTVTVSAVNACIASADVIIPVDISCIGVYFPSAFTPNGDGQNDLFGPVGSLSSLSNYHFSIYNRWGQKVFNSNNPFQKWDGRLQGKLNDNNLFVWYAEYMLPGQGKSLRKGTVLLIK
jgi:gliding motility-associated-like protein